MLKIAVALIISLLLSGISVQEESYADHVLIETPAPEGSEVQGEQKEPAEQNSIEQSLKEQNIYAPLKTKQVDDDYNINGRIYLSDRRTAVKAEASSDTDIHIKGTMTRVEGEIQLVYEDSDGSRIILAESKENTEQPVSIDTELSIKKGTGYIHFSGASAIYDFDISFELSDDIKYYLD